MAHMQYLYQLKVPGTCESKSPLTVSFCTYMTENFYVRNMIIYTYKINLKHTEVQTTTQLSHSAEND